MVTVTHYVTATAAPTPEVQHKAQWGYHGPASSKESSAPSAVYTSVEEAPVEESSAKPSTTFATSAASAASPPASTSAASPSSYDSGSSTTSSSPSSGTGITTNNLTPNGKKAGLSGYIGIQEMQAFSELAPYISWYSDYAPDTPDAQGVKGIGMLWGASGSACGDVTPERVSLFHSMLDNDSIPEIMFGFYEPDCDCDMSAQMTVSDAQTQWDALLAPLADKGVVLGSPSMCKQKDEDFLTPFLDNGARDWDVTSIHINKPDLDGVKEDVEYYVSTYGKPIWVSEFSCVNDADGWSPCTDQTQINKLINDAVSYFESNEHIVAYGPSNGAGLGNVWPLTSNGELTESGKTYLNAIKNF
ncbi:hypothetical protein KC351_g17531 [Hortaea werneckii]|nr:hypothetical protein KC351_g17531 [Hortaea werneckii]